MPRRSSQRLPDAVPTDRRDTQRRVVVVVGACCALGRLLVKKLLASRSCAYHLVLTSTCRQRLDAMCSEDAVGEHRHSKVALDLLQYDHGNALLDTIRDLTCGDGGGGVVCGVFFLAHHFRTASLWVAEDADVDAAGRFVAHASDVLLRLARCVCGRVVFAGASSGRRIEAGVAPEAAAAQQSGGYPGSLHALIKGQLRETCFRLHEATRVNLIETRVVHVTIGKFGHDATLSTDKVARVLLNMLENAKAPASFNVDVFGPATSCHPSKAMEIHKAARSSGDGVVPNQTPSKESTREAGPTQRPHLDPLPMSAESSTPADGDALATSLSLAKHLRCVQESLLSLLGSVECQQVARDELERSLDVLDNLPTHNAQYFGRRKHNMTVLSLLPRNQPLYSLVCFAVIPSLMSTEVVVRPSSAVAALYPKLFELLELRTFTPSLQLYVGSNGAVVDAYRGRAHAVIVTGRPETAASLRRQFPANVLFVVNGAGHNPIVVLPGASVRECVASILRTTLQNQGQDCCAPCTVAVHASMYAAVRALVLQGVAQIVRHHTATTYASPSTLVGPNTDRMHALLTAQRLGDVAAECIFGGDINVATGMIWPTVLERHLSAGPYLTEWFAPVVPLQCFDNDSTLIQHLFLHKAYASGAMYLTLFGDAPSVARVANITRACHPPNTLVINTDVHAVERGFLPYGGYGIHASHLRIGAHIVPCPTLPQRDLCWLAGYMAAGGSSDAQAKHQWMERLGAEQEGPTPPWAALSPMGRLVGFGDMWSDVVDASAAVVDAAS